jgi:thiamine biosynthesis lipoprotein
MRRFLLVIILIWSGLSYGQVATSIDTLFMGSSFSFTAVSMSPEVNQMALEAGMQEVTRIENMISSWNPDSETSEINRNAGIEPTKVSYELYELIRRSKRISKLSNGYFDISFAAMNTLWDFSSGSTYIPDQEGIDRAIHLVNYENIQLNEDDTSVFLVNKRMKIGFGAIGKGFAANRAKAVMLEKGAESGVVNAGGDLIGWGTRDDGKSWNIGIQDPLDKHNILLSIPINNQAVVTSGNYEKFIEIKGEKYCHILNPKTGWPAKNLRSVTIICADTELADALSTTVFVLGKEKGLELINQLKDVECIIIDEVDDMHFSANINSNSLGNEN